MFFLLPQEVTSTLLSKRKGAGQARAAPWLQREGCLAPGPLHLPCAPCLDIEHPLLWTKEVWLPRLLSLELMWLPLPLTRLCLAICLHLLGCHMPGHPHPKRRHPPVPPGLSHTLFLPLTHGGAGWGGMVPHHRTWKASGGPRVVHLPRCLLVNRTPPVPQGAWRESATLEKLSLLSLFLGFPSKICVILALKSAQTKAQGSRVLHFFSHSDIVI